MNHESPSEIIFEHSHLNTGSEIDLDFVIDYDPDSFFKEDYQLGINELDTTGIIIVQSDEARIQWYVHAAAISVSSIDRMDAVVFKGIVM